MVISEMPLSDRRGVSKIMILNEMNSSTINVLRGLYSPNFESLGLPKCLQCSLAVQLQFTHLDSQ